MLMVRMLDLGKRKEKLLMIAAVSSLVAIMTCIICDFFVSKQLDWSVIVTMSMIVAWLFVPVTFGSKASVRNGLLVASFLCVPYLVALSIILEEQAVMILGGAIAIFTCLMVWFLYFLSLKLKGQPLLMIGTIFLLSIPFIMGIVWLHDSYFHRVSNSTEYSLSLSISFLLAVGCFLLNMLKRFSYK